MDGSHENVLANEQDEHQHVRTFDPVNVGEEVLAVPAVEVLAQEEETDAEEEGHVNHK